jgi:hypothetical protein
MLRPPIDAKTFAQALAEQGLTVPAGCVGVQLRMDESGVMLLRYEVRVRAEDLSRLAKVFTNLAKQLDEATRS